MLSESEKNNLIEKSKFKLHLKDKTKISENQLKELLINNNFDCDMGGVNIFGKWYLTENVNECFIEYNNLDDLNNFRSEIRNLKNETIKSKLNYSKFNGNVCYSDCENCIFNFGKNKECLNCNYYIHCNIEKEIDDFERNHDKALERFYNRLENEEFPL